MIIKNRASTTLGRRMIRKLRLEVSQIIFTSINVKMTQIIQKTKEDHKDGLIHHYEMMQFHLFIA